mmetsp:Transcript_24368/g.47615  ORF Transcript_24368/g.47615 Transcript_24368/m.47615 type:complete len:82 (-) Transcript_24368:228-473(-)
MMNAKGGTSSNTVRLLIWKRVQGDVMCLKINSSVGAACSNAIGTNKVAHSSALGSADVKYQWRGCVPHFMDWLFLLIVGTL